MCFCSRGCVCVAQRNSNLLVAANSKPELTVLNFSTGRIVSRASLPHRVLALEADLTHVLFAGDTEVGSPQHGVQCSTVHYSAVQ